MRCGSSAPQAGRPRPRRSCVSAPGWRSRAWLDRRRGSRRARRPRPRMPPAPSGPARLGRNGPRPRSPRPRRRRASGARAVRAIPSWSWHDNTAMRDRLEEAAERWGTPIYVTDVDAAVANAERWREAYPEALIAYAVKANPDPALLRRLAQEGFGFEVVGPIELALALRTGCSPERMVVNGVGQTDADLADALASGALVNAESVGALDALLAAGPGRIGLRVNPALDADTHPHLATGAAASKFGVALDELPEASGRIRKAGVELSCIGAHIGSGITDVQPFSRLAQVLTRLAAETGAQGIDLGGGFAGAPGHHADAVRAHLPPGLPLILEPGRSIVGDAGWLVTRVVRVQER